MKTLLNNNVEVMKGIKELGFKRVQQDKEERATAHKKAILDLLKLDIQDKNARQVIANWQVSRVFSNDLYSELRETFEGLDEENMEDVKTMEYYASVVRVANAQINKTIRPLTDALGAMQQALANDNYEDFKKAMKGVFGLTVSKEQFACFMMMNTTGNRRQFKEMSGSQFANTFMWVLVASVERSGSYSPKMIRGTINKVIKEVPTITEDQYFNLDTSTVDFLIKECDIKVKKGDTFEIKAEKVRKAAKSKYAVKPNFEVE